MPEKRRSRGLLIYGIALFILIGSGTYFVWRSVTGYSLFWEENIGGGTDEDLQYLDLGSEYLVSLDNLDMQGADLEKEEAEDYLLGAELAVEEPTNIWDRIQTHEVSKGESLWTIARNYNVDVDTIIGANELKSHDKIDIGQKLTILPFKGVTHRVEKGESLWAIAQRYNVPIDEIVETNALSSQNIKVGELLVIPGATLTAAEKERRLLIARGGLPLFIKPAEGRISSRFGMRWGQMHQGLDLAIPTGTPVRASAAGTVSQAGNAGTYGLLVIIKHANGIETRYAHNSKLNVKVGQYVKQGDIIAYSGNTGRSTGPHLHFEIRVNGQPQDPLKWIN